MIMISVALFSHSGEVELSFSISIVRSFGDSTIQITQYLCCRTSRSPDSDLLIPTRFDLSTLFRSAEKDRKTLGTP